MFKTFSATPADIQQDWYVVDAEGMVLGRLATEIARIIRGKHKPMFTPHMDTGDGVIVINASKVRVTGRKAEQKEYFRHTGYMGHERFTPFASMLAKHPERIIEKAVFGMLPKTALGRQVLRGKHKPMFTPHMDTGDGVIVINASKVRVTGRKAEQKEYFRHTGYMGHERFTPFASMLAKHPERVIEKAVFGMLPKTALGRQVLRGKLRVYPGAEHPHVAQAPKTLTFKHAEAK